MLKPDVEGGAYQAVFANNRRWAEARRATSPEFFEHLSRDQSPEFMYIGCSDSRVPANEVMGLEPGEVFVHTNVANLVVNTDLNVHTALEYAVAELRIDHIVVCGHYGCGGVRAAMQPTDLGLLNGWLREVRDVYRLHRAELDAIGDESARSRRLVELNVREQCIRVASAPCVQREYQRWRKPLVHGWVFSPEDGRLRDLDVEVSNAPSEHGGIYHLEPSV